MNHRIAVVAIGAGFATSPARAAPPPDVSPFLYQSGNVRVAISCADAFLTPDRGLQVTLDGMPLRPGRTNYVTSESTDADNNTVYSSAVSDVGFLAPAGRHHLRIDGPDCIPDERDLDVPGAWTMHLDGRLAIANRDLLGPTGAPDGITLVLGAFSSTYPAALRTGVTSTAPTSYSLDATSAHGGWISTGIERRHFVFAADVATGWGSLAGTVTRIPDPRFPTTPPAAVPMTGSFLASSLALRLGARIPLGSISLAAGSGIGGALWITTSAHLDRTATTEFVEAPEGASATWFVPVWATATVKPSCDWGVQVLASTNVEPTSDGVTFTVGAMYQPSASCAEPVGVRESP